MCGFYVWLSISSFVPVMVWLLVSCLLGCGFIAPCIWVLSVRFALGCYGLWLVVFVGLVGLVLGVC